MEQTRSHIYDPKSQTLKADASWGKQVMVDHEYNPRWMQQETLLLADLSRLPTIFVQSSLIS